MSKAPLCSLEETAGGAAARSASLSDRSTRRCLQVLSVLLSKSRRAPQRSGKVRGSEGQSHMTPWRRAEYSGGRLSERSHCGKKVSAARSLKSRH